MVRQRAKPVRARQHARPGSCYELPIVVSDEEQKKPDRMRAALSSLHTASWMEAKASGRWVDPSPTGETSTSTFASTVTGPHEQAADSQQGRISRRHVQVEPIQHCRKRARPDIDIDIDIDDDADTTDRSAKRLRLSGIGMAVGEDSLRGRTSHIDPRPYQLNNNSHYTNFYSKQTANDFAKLEANAGATQQKSDLERATIKVVRRAEEQARLREEEKQAHEAGVRDQQYRFASQSNLQQMWQEYDRERRAAEELRQRREWEEREEIKRKEQEAEIQRLNEISSLERTLKGQWEAHDLARGLRHRPGQLSERGQALVRERTQRALAERERAERLQRDRQRVS